MADENAHNSKQPEVDADAWQDLAEDLFGIDLGRTSAAEASDDDDDLIRFAITEAVPSELEEAEPSQDDDESGKQPAASEPAAEEPAEQDDDSPASSEAAQDRPADPYWDALNNWSWGDGGTDFSKSDKTKTRVDTAADAVEGAGETVATDDSAKPASPAAVTPSEPIRQRSDAFVEDDAFGAGILDDIDSGSSTRLLTDTQSAAKSATEGPCDDEREPRAATEADGKEPGMELETQTASDSDVKAGAGKHRRRRRRRRAKPSDAKPTDETIEESEPNGDRASAAAREAEEPLESPDQETTRPKRTRRRSRRRRKEDVETAPDEDVSFLEEDQPEPVGVAFAPPGEKKAEAESSNRDKYKNVPTWEEAISYLVGKSSGGGRRSSDRAGD